MRCGLDTRPVVRALEGLLACHDLPEALPGDPMPLLCEWIEEAKASGCYDDHNAMTLATCTADGRPSARIVLCKAIEQDPPALLFFTSYDSRKGVELDGNPNAAVVFHWPHARRQARIEGRVEKTTAEESDTYFRTRPLLSRIGARVSLQSHHIESRHAMISEAMRIARKAAVEGRLDRPGSWGGYRVLPTRIELWSASTGRLHDRAVWERTGSHAAWNVQRLGA